MLSLLPTTLIALLLSLPAFSEPVSPNEPLRHLALQAPKPVEHPICCLKPLTPLEPMDDEILLTFEEWKKKQLVLQTETVETMDGQATSGTGTEPGTGAEANSDGEAVMTTSDSNISGSHTGREAASGGQWTGLSPHFRVPLTDRFNYASLDCSARVHMSHRSAKSASSILSSKKDRYMLSPCNNRNEKQFVVVELCDDIRIDTVQLANFEFFSGVFKDFTVSVARTYSTDNDGWAVVGTYRAKNIRGVQSFHPPTSLRDFYRYIRIDFESHYGTEYFCPISLLRVYGLTHLEQWKWDIWEAESRAKAEYESQIRRSLPADATVDTPVFPDVVITTPSFGQIPVTNQNTNNTLDGQVPVLSDNGENSAPASSHPGDPNTAPAADVQQSPPSSDSIPEPVGHHSQDHANDTAASPEQPRSHSTDTFASSQATAAPSSETPSHPQISSNIPASSSVNLSTKPSSSVENISNPSPHANPNHNSNASHAITSAPLTVPPAPPPTPTIILTSGSPSVAVIPIIQSSMVPPSKGGESIYRTIMNRLTAVESNHTLYLRYIEQQNTAIRDVIKRLGEDIGRLEGINRGQALMYQRAFNDWEHQRYQLQMDYGDLASRVEKLSEEIILEKRLGFAQLCILLAVLVFMGLTRGSRAETVIERAPTVLNGSVREWGRRHLTLSGDWRSPFRGHDVRTSGPGTPERDTTVVQSALLSRKKTGMGSGRLVPPPLQLDDERVTFPTGSASARKEPLGPIHLNTAPVSFPHTSAGDYFQRPRTISNPRSNPRSRAPSLKSTPNGRRTQHIVQPKPATPTRASWRAYSFGLQRSNSQGATPAAPTGMPHSGSWNAGVHAPKSARRWARTAHLHEVKSASLLPASARLNPGSISSYGDHDFIRDQHDKTPREVDFGNDKVAQQRRGHGQLKGDENVFGDIRELKSARISRQSEVDSEGELEKEGRGGGFPFPGVGGASGNGGDSEVLAREISPGSKASLLLRVDSLSSVGNGKRHLPVEDEGDAWVDTDSADNSEVDYDPLL